jgi:beta-xylosidase
MTLYEKNYKARLNEMLDEMIRKYGHEDDRVILFATMVDKRMDNPNYQNREYLERVFKGWMK